MKSKFMSSGNSPIGKGVALPFFVSIFILFFGFTSVVSAQSVPRGASGTTFEIMNGDTWEALGNGVTGMDAVVKTIVEYNGYVYVGGVFDTAGDVPARNIARFNLSNSQWEAIGTGTDAGMGTMVNDIAVHNGLIYVGGYFTQMNGLSIGNLAVYNPSGAGSWSSIGTFGHSAPEFINVFALHVFGDDLYVGGEFQSITKEMVELEVQHLARYNITAGTWHRVGEYTSGDPFDIPSMDGTVMAIDGNDTELVFSGAFSGAGDQTVNGIVRYNPAGLGTWTPFLGLGDNDTPGSATFGEGVIYVSGSFFDNDFNMSYIKAYNIQNQTWEDIGSDTDGNSKFNNGIINLTYYNDALFVVGDFTEVDGVTSAGVAKYDPVSGEWSTFGTGVTTFGGAFSGGVSLGFAENKLIVGGNMTDAGDVAVNNIARWSEVFGEGSSGGGLPNITLVAPGDTDTDVSTDPFFEWEAPQGVTVTSYSLFIDDTDQVDESAPYQIDGLTLTEYQYGFGDLPLLGNTTYYWIIKAYNGNDLVAQTETPFSFTTEVINTVTPTLVSPVGVEDVSLTPTFTWKKDDLAVSYVLEYQEGTTIDMSATVVPLALDDLAEVGENYTYTLPQVSALTAGTQYTWQVSVSSADPFDIKTSDPASFTTVDLSPGAFNWDYDQLELIVNSNTEIFNTSWTQSDGATSYELNFKIGEQTFTALGDPVVVNAPETSYEVDNTKLIDGFTYTVELTAVNDYGRTSTDPLTIVYTPTKPVAMSPVDEAPVDANTSFEWESTENVGIIPGNILVQILYTNDENADPVANSTDGIQFDFPGTTDVEESKTLTELFATQNDVDVTQFLEANMGNTLYWRVSNKSIRINEADAETQREVVWSDMASFSVPATPQAFELLTPANPSTDISVTPTFTWEQSENAASYVLSISTDENMADPVFTSTSLTRGDDPDEVSFELPSEDRLLFGETYYWQVTANGSGGQIQSEISEFSTPAEGIKLTSPVNDKVFTSTSELEEETFTWESYSNAEDFSDVTVVFNLLFKDQSSEYSQLRFLTTRGITSRSISATSLIHGFTYSWEINNIYNNGSTTISTLSDRRTFRINAEKPVLSGPISGAEIMSTTPFEWTTEERFNAGGIGDTYYGGEFHVQILFDETTDVEQLTEDQGFQFFVDGTDALTESFTLEQLFATLEGDDAPTIDDLMSRAGQTLYWRVKIDPEYPELEQDREVVWSDVESFVLAEIAPITLISPGASDSDVPENVTLRPTFSWEVLSDLENVYYILEVSKNEDFSTLFGSSTTQQASSMIELDLDGPATYYWRVKAIIGANGSEIVGQSATRSFKTNTNIEIVSLDNEATNVDLDSVFEWYANDPQFFLSIHEPGTGKTLAVNPSPNKRYTLQEAIDNRVITNSETNLNTLEPNKTYNWFVSRFDERFNFLGTSETRTFTTSVNFGAEPPVLGEVEILTQRSVRLSWTGNAPTYLIQVAEKKDDEETISWLDVGIVTGLTAEIYHIDAGKNYLWRIIGVNSEGDMLATSEIGEFIIPKQPDVITVSYPGSIGDTNIPITNITFSWEPDPNATKYQILVYEAADQDLETPVIDEMHTPTDEIYEYTTSADIILKYSTYYKWRVIGYNGDIRGELNILTDFSTENIPSSISLNRPAQQAPREQGDYQFEFSVITSGIGDDANLVYEIAASRDALIQADPLILDENESGLLIYDDISQPSQIVRIPESRFEDGQTYYWRVSTQAENSNGYISSEIGEFKVTRTPAQPVITSPAATNVPLTGVIFTWNTDPFADAYQVTLRKKDGEQAFAVTVPAITEQSQSYTLNNQSLFYNTEYEFSVTAINGDRVGLTRTLTFKTVAATSTQVSLSSSMRLSLIATNSNTFFKSTIADEICKALGLNTPECARVEIVTSTAKDRPSEPDLINAGDAIILLIWEQPETPEEFPITHYSIQYRPAGADYWNQFSRPESPDTIAVFTGFDPETRYDIRIAGVNENGIGEYSEPVEVETISIEEVLAFIEEVAAEITDTSIEVEEIPTEFTLFQNYPNPFNPTTTVRFALPEPSEVQLEVYTILGQRIAVLSTGLKPAGYHSVQLDASRWASGTYIYRLRAGDRVFTKKLLLLK